MNPPGLQSVPYDGGEGVVPRFVGGRPGLRPPAACFGVDDARKPVEASDLRNTLDNPTEDSPMCLGNLFAPATITLAKKGRRFVGDLVRKQSFSASRQEQKSHERACRHRGLNVPP